MHFSQAETAPEFADEDPHAGVRQHRELSPWRTGYGTQRVVGRKLEAEGRWPEEPSNDNYAGRAAGDEEEEEEEEEEEGGDVSDAGSEDSDDQLSRMRRCEFTLLRLD